MQNEALIHPRREQNIKSWVDVDSGVKLPDLHCAFAGCSWTSTLGDVKNTLEGHICNSPADCPGAFVWPRVLKEQHQNFHMRMDYYAAAIEEKERQKMADVGTSIDRRPLSFLQHCTGSHAIHSLSCFVCAQIKTDMRGSLHQAYLDANFDKAFQKWYPPLEQRPSDISYVPGQYFQKRSSTESSR